MRRTEGEAGLGHAHRAGVLDGEGDAEVGDERRAIVQQDVLRLDVAMHDAVTVGVVECRKHFARDADRVVNGKLCFALEALTQRLASDERHHVIEIPARFSGVVQGEDVRMLQVRRRANLGKESLWSECGGEVGVEDLECHLSRVLDVAREVNRGHAAGADLPLDLIAVAEGGGERRPFSHGDARLRTTVIPTATTCGSGAAELTAIHGRRKQLRT